MNPETTNQGTRVRVIGNAERQGTVAAVPANVGGNWYVLVQYDDGSTNNTPLENLEPLPLHRDAIAEAAGGHFQGPESLRRNLLHEKLNGRLSEVIYSMDASKTQFLAYQFKPVLRLLESPTNSLLIADEVGLGKTIEAGLIWTELRAREAARSLLVVCPPHLVTKWRNELKNRFGVDAGHADAGQVLECLKNAENHGATGFALVASYHSLRSNESLTNQLDQWGNASAPFLDLLVMDEAAIMRNDTSLTSRLGALLAPIARHKVYLSATPLHTHSENLRTLLRRLDPDTFSDAHGFQDILRANEPLVALRRALLGGAASRVDLLGHVDSALSLPLLQGSNSLAALRASIATAEDLSNPRLRAELAYQSERANLLSSIVNRTRKKDVETHPVEREVNTVRVPLTPEERAFYEEVTALVLRYASERGITAGFLTVMPQRRSASCIAATCERLQLANPPEDSDEVSPDAPWIQEDEPAVVTQGGPLIQYLREKLTGRHRLDRLREHDSKFQRLLAALQEYWRQNPGGKMVLFAYFKPTLYYLAERLRENGIPSIMLTGDEPGDRQDIVDRFSQPDSAPILLSSEVGGEGLDMPFACALVNYDLPWNPMVVEQRIGRIHRIGQEAERIVVINLICEDTVDERIYDRLYDRLGLFQRTLGDLEAVIGPIIHELRGDLLSHTLTPAQQSARIDRAALALQENMLQEADLEQNAAVLAAYGDYLVNQINAAHQRGDWINSADVEEYVLGFFRNSFPATRIQGINAERRMFEMELDPSALHEFDLFLGGQRQRGQTRLGVAGRHRVVFDHRMYAKPPAQTEVIHQAHPLIRFISHHQRVNRTLQPLAVAVTISRDRVPLRIPSGRYAFVSQRWAVEGVRSYDRLYHEIVNLGTNTRLEEVADATSLIEIAAALGSPMDHSPRAGTAYLDEAVGVIRHLEHNALVAFNNFLNRCKMENEDRQRIQRRGIDGFERRRREILQGVRAGHLVAGRQILLPAIDGQLESLRQKCDQQRHKIEQSQTRSDGSSTLAAGIIHVQ